MMKYLVTALFLLLLPCAAEAASRFAVCTTTCTWDNSSTAMWAASSGGATGQSAPTTSDAVIFDAATCVGGTTCTTTVNADVIVNSLTIGNCTASSTGCILDFSVNNNNITISGASGFSGSGTGTRNLKMGDGTWTLSAPSLVSWTMTTTTNLTFNANNSTIAFANSAIAGPNQRIFNGGALTYHILSIGSAAGGIQALKQANTFATLNITAPITISFEASTTQTVTNAINWNGTSTNQIGLFSSSSAGQGTISSANNGAMTWVGLWNVKFQGGGTFAATNSMAIQPNSLTGVTVTPPAAFSATTPCILGGWLLWRDLPNHINDNYPAWIDQAA